MRTCGGMRRLILLCLPFLFLCLMTAGCSKQGTVSGKVYYKGQPLTGGTVYFVPEARSGQFTSTIGRDGSYSISKLPPGRARIGVSAAASMGIPAGVFQKMGGKNAEKGLKQMRRIGEAASSGGEAGKVTEQPVPKDIPTLPKKYGDADESGLTIDVTGGNQPFDIEIP